MITVLMFLFAGFLFGWLLRKREKSVTLFTRLTDISIYVLLFFMGVSVGGNEKIIDNIGEIGIQVLAISFAGVTGSVLLSWLVYKVFFEDNN